MHEYESFINYVRTFDDLIDVVIYGDFNARLGVMNVSKIAESMYERTYQILTMSADEVMKFFYDMKIKSLPVLK